MHTVQGAPGQLQSISNNVSNNGTGERQDLQRNSRESRHYNYNKLKEKINAYHSFNPVLSVRTNSLQIWSCFTGSLVSSSCAAVSVFRALTAECLNTDTEDWVRGPLGRSGKRYPAEVARRGFDFLSITYKPWECQSNAHIYLMHATY